MNDYLERAQEFCRKTNTVIKVEFLENDLNCSWDVGKCHAKYKVTIIRKINGTTKRGMTFNFWQSIDGTKKNIAPDEYEILACLTKYDPYSFEDFCAEYGYEMYDSEGWYNRESKKVYQNVRREYDQVFKVFGDVIEGLRDIW